MFNSLSEARSRCAAFARCPLAQKSTQMLKYVKLSCFRSEVCNRKELSTPDDSHRSRKTMK
jgi:hypothetical protein